MSFAKNRLVTVDKTKCGSSDTTDYTFRFDSTDVNLKHTSHGGNIQHASAFDTAFGPNANGSSPYPFQLVLYDGTAGRLVADIKIPLLTVATNAALYLAYGDSGVSVDPSSTAAWRSAFKSVVRGGDGTTLNLNDATSNGLNATNHNVTATAGKCVGGMLFNGTTAYLSYGTPSALNFTGAFAFGCWINSTVLPTDSSNELSTIMSHGWSGTASQYDFIFRSDPGFDPVVNLYAGYYDGADHSTHYNLGSNIVTGTAYFLWIMYDGTNWKIFRNGVQVSSTAGTAPASNSQGVSVGGRLNSGSLDLPLNCVMENLYFVGGTVPSADEILAMFNNQNSPSTFYTLGSENAASFTISPNAGHANGASLTINVTYANGATAPSSGAVPFSMTGAGSITAGSWVHDSSTTGHFTFTEGAVSGTPTVFTDTSGQSLGTQNFSNAAVVPGAPTIGTLTDLGGGSLSITFSAPADNGGASITTYTATSSSGGVQGTASASPITITGANTLVAQTVTVTATNSVGTGSASSASNSVTPAFAALPGYATFDGTGGTYFTHAALNATKTYPFWYGAWVLLDPNYDYSTLYGVMGSGGTAGSTYGFIYQSVPHAQAYDGSATSTADSPQAVVASPYWEHLLFEYRSATDRRIYINGGLNGTQEAQSTTSRVIDLSTGSPVTTIGKSPGLLQPFLGGIRDVVFGTGTLSGADRTLLATLGENYANVSGGVTTNWYPLTSSGVDSVGGTNMTAVGTVVYSSAVAINPRPATRSQVHLQVFKQTAYRSELPTVSTGQTSPVSTSGWTNLADVEFLDVSFTGTAGAWATRIYHYRPTTPVIPGGHLVFQDGGHEFTTDWSSFGTSAVIQQMVAAGYGVAATMMPGFGNQDTGYTGSTPDHNAYWSTLTASVNGLERFIGPNVIAMNHLQNRYVKRSIVGLSGGGWRAVHYGAVDDRINHAIISIRGTLPDRRLIGPSGDFEQRPYPNGYKVEEIYRLCAERNRRLVIAAHPTDTTGFAKFDTSGSGGGGGAYLDPVDLDLKFLAPLRAQYPRSDVKFYEDQGVSAHSYTQDFIDNALMPALRTPLPALHRPRTSARLGLRAA